MKIAFISDLHHLHWDRVAEYPVDEVCQSLEKHKPDLLLDAGDYERVIDWPCNSMSIPGNHDYYGHAWDEMQHVLDTKAFEFKGLKIAMATLWTTLNNGDHYARIAYKRSLADCGAIRGFTPEIAWETNKKHIEFLKQNKGADIIVTHHVPTFDAVHDRYKKGYAPNTMAYMVNYGFASHLDDLIEELQPKIWHFGHTHDPYDFKIGKTRMICNPCGYPSERFSIREGKPYEPVYIKL